MTDQNPDGGDHADQAQDVALFKSLIQKYLGEDHSDNEEALEMAKHAYEAHRESGMEHEAACEATGNHLKMAAEVGKRMAQNEAHETHHENEAHNEGGCDDSSDDSHSDGDSHSAPNFQKKKMEKETHYESSQKMKLLGEISRLRESVKKYELGEYLDKKLKDTGRSNQTTKTFREALGVPKSKEHIDSAYKLFMAGLNQKGDDSEFSPFFAPEKVYLKESKEINFSDCLS